MTKNLSKLSKFWIRYFTVSEKCFSVCSVLGFVSFILIKNSSETSLRKSVFYSDFFPTMISLMHANKSNVQAL